MHRPYDFVTGEFSKDGWNVSEYYTGLMVGAGNTIVEAMENTNIALADHNILTPFDMLEFTKGNDKINK